MSRGQGEKNLFRLVRLVFPSLERNQINSNTEREIERGKNGTESKGSQRRRRRKRDNSRQGQAVFKCGCCCFCLLPVRTHGNIFIDWYGRGRTVVRKHLPFFFLHSRKLQHSRFFCSLEYVPPPPPRKRKKEREKKPTPLSLFAYITKLYYSLSGNIAAR